MVVLTGGALLLGLVVVAFVMATSGPSTSAALMAPTDPTPQGLWDGRAIGSKSAPATLLAFEDFQCPACDAFSTQMEPQLVKDYVSSGKLRIVYNDFAFIGQESSDAAVAARCAGDEGLFWPYHDYLFANQQGENRGAPRSQGGFSRDRLVQIATAVGTDKAKFTACLDTQSPLDGVKAETADGAARGINSTPTLFLNGKMIVGVPAYLDLAKQIDAIVAGGSAAPSGSAAPGGSTSPAASSAAP